MMNPHLNNAVEERRYGCNRKLRRSNYAVVVGVPRLPMALSFQIRITPNRHCPLLRDVVSCFLLVASLCPDSPFWS